MIVRRDVTYTCILHKTNFGILSLNNNFYYQQFHQNKSIPRHMETRQNQRNSEYNYQWNLKTTYRPVSILRILSKIYEGVVLEQITNFIEKKLIYHHHQFGYCKNHSTATLLAKLRDVIKKVMKASEITLAAFADYSKAFNTIDFSILIKKMHTLLNVFYIGFLAI